MAGFFDALPGQHRRKIDIAGGRTLNGTLPKWPTTTQHCYPQINDIKKDEGRPPSGTCTVESSPCKTIQYAGAVVEKAAG